MQGPSIGSLGTGPGVEHSGNLETRVARLENWIDYLQNYHAYPLMPAAYTLTASSQLFVGGVTVPWQAIRPLLQIPADRWDGWLSGFVSPVSTDVQIAPCYIPDSGTAIPLMPVTTIHTVGLTKVWLGPFPVLGPLAQAKGVPKGENVLAIGMLANVVTNGKTADFIAWTLWIRQSPTRS